MTDEEIEKRAVDFATKNPRIGVFMAQVDAFIAGAKENGVVWHDLRENPHDLPNPYKDVIDDEGCVCFLSITFEKRKRKPIWRYYGGDECDYERPAPIAWCEFPVFERKNLQLSNQIKEMELYGEEESGNAR